MICYHSWIDKLLIFSVISVWQLVEKNSINFCPGVYYIYFSLSLPFSYSSHPSRSRAVFLLWDRNHDACCYNSFFVCYSMNFEGTTQMTVFNLLLFVFFQLSSSRISLLWVIHFTHPWSKPLWTWCSSSQHHRHFRSGLPAPHPHSASLSIYPSGSASGTACLWACSQHHYGHM